MKKVALVLGGIQVLVLGRKKISSRLFAQACDLMGHKLIR